MTTHNHQTITTWAELGRWFGTGDNRRRYVTVYELFTADYYGRGPHLYLRGQRYTHYIFQGSRCISPPLGGFVDGHHEWIAKTLERCGVENLAQQA